MKDRVLVGCAYCGELMTHSRLMAHHCTARELAQAERDAAADRERKERAKAS